MKYFGNSCIQLCGVLLLGLSNVCAAASATLTADEAAIRALLNRIEQVFAAGDLDGAMSMFTDDAIILQSGGPDIAGAKAIRETYAAMIKQYKVGVKLSSATIVVSGDLAVEHGTYTFKLTDKVSSKIALDAHSRYLHVFKRQPDGTWKTWRMMTNDPTAPAP